MKTIAHDMVIRGGLVIDGSGSPAFRADVAINGGRITAIGPIEGSGKEEIDAADCLVTPGFVDVHTHYDGQATWEHTLAPSSGHGVTTVVTGNCGVGFAPVRPSDHQVLIKVMEGVEDIPEVVMAEGISWNWETFPDYLDVLSVREFDIDVATQIPHSPLRVYVMGQRGADHEPSTPEDRVAMAKLVTEAVQAGAIGVSTSRSPGHRLKNGKLAPSIDSADEEILALASGLKEAGAGVFQIITNASGNPAEEISLVRKLAETSQRPVSFTLLQVPRAPEDWRISLKHVEQANADGLAIRGQVFPRPVGVLLGLDLSLNPFLTRLSYRAIEKLPLAERVAILRDPAFKAKLLAEVPIPDPQPMLNELCAQVNEMFVLDDRAEYTPPADKLICNLAASAGVSAESLAYDLLLGDEGKAILYLPGANYVGNTLNAVREMMASPYTILGLGDGGAHYGLICDASYPTFMLTHWVRDASPEQRFPIEWAISELSRKPAEAVGLMDRGLLKPGMKADVNVINLDRLRLSAPRTAYDLPSGGRRLQQRAEGYVATVVSGMVTYRNGKATGALPGRLVRRQQAQQQSVQGREGVRP
ncbi:N-acyl-D-amino-acid deacylase family protein [Noviherbaspirillum sedimenti]|uniref:D-aminoacylase n=1 Tax=Noviherbaspirillum sedimenti TaxID=2320865 RepID=A0A3A3FWM1_9BURK|nr:amidohydrolase family protein [Noviherbaspirillum sedimenti]RJG00618.1 D-aminoacylase [Noviherbaspirillum sedimenti]